MNNRQTPKGNRQYVSATPDHMRPNPGGVNLPKQGASVRQNSQPQRRNVHPQTRPPKPVLTPEQIAAKEAARKRELSNRKKQRAAARKTFGARFLLYLITVAIVGLAAYAIFRMSLTSSDADGASKYTYVIGDKKYRLDYSIAYRNGKAYVSFSDIASLCDLAIMGSPENMSFIIKSDVNDNQVIRFVDGSKVAYINDVEAELGAPSFYEDGEVYIPVEFVKTYVNGINVDYNERSKDISVQRVITNLNEKGRVPKGEEPQYMEMSFLLKPPNGIKPLNFEEYENVVEQPDLGFKSNLNYYEQFMNPGSMTDYLTVVNSTYPLSDEYTPQDLLLVVDSSIGDGQTVSMMREIAAMSMEAMMKELRGAGYRETTVTTAYFGFSESEEIPGSDEHRLGLSAHIGLKPPEEDEGEDTQETLPEEEPAYTVSDVHAWLRDNSWKFGFILRYPSDKQDITGVAYEPEHFRYVGRYHAEKMYENGLCLEEYVERYYPEVLGAAPQSTLQYDNE